MLIEFSTENFSSYKEIQTFSLQATSQKEAENTIAHRLFYFKKNLRLLKTKAVFGGNASGKSNLISAMSAFWKIINLNLQVDNILKHQIIPFRLDKEYINKPSYFQIILLIENIQYRYGFEADKNRIHSEWLYVKKKSEVPYFIREGQNIVSFNQLRFSEVKEVFGKKNKLYKEQTLILSVLNALNTTIATILYKGIISDISINSGDSNSKNFWTSRSITNFKLNNQYRDFVNNLLQSMDDTILRIGIKEGNLGLEGTDFREKVDLPVTYRRLGDKETLFSLELEEAAGTQKVFAISFAIYRALTKGKTYIIDEFDAYMHPKLTRMIISLFHSEDAHPQSQLIFVSHDTNLLDAALLRRDQISFIEKTTKGASEIFDLSDIKGVRENDLFEKNYLKGSYGGLPYLRNLENIIANG